MSAAAAPLRFLAVKPPSLAGPACAGLFLLKKRACGPPTASLSGKCVKCTGGKTHFQTRLVIGASNDLLEQEADRVADQVVASTHSTVSGAPPHIQRLSENSAGEPGAIPSSVDHVLASPGKPLDPLLRRDMELRFGHDFSQVRVHSGVEAEESARDVNANAYTVGHDVVFGSGRYAPRNRGGHRLIAHELTHVVQQLGGAVAGVQRKPLGNDLFPPDRTNYRFDTGQITMEDLSDPEISARLHTMTRSELRAYRMLVSDPAVQDYIGSLLVPRPTAQLETNAATLTKADFEKSAALSYWEQRTWGTFDLSQGFPQRMAASAEERDAVYSTLWQVFPNGSSTPPSSKLVTIPPNTQRRNALLYQFIVRAPTQPGGKPALEIEFQLERPGHVADTAAEPPGGYVARQLTFTSDIGFPKSADAYFAQHRDERRQIAYWLKQAGGTFDQLVVTRGTPKGGKGPPQETLFRISGKKEKNGEISELDIELRPGGRPVEVTPSDDYRNRDYGDLLIEQQQSRPHPKKGDTLGYVNVAGVPAEEVTSVKFAVVRYFRDVETRDAEADVLVPIAGTSKEVYYTLRFRPDNEVDIERIGEKGSSSQLDPTRMDIARVRGYGASAGDPARLKTWLGRRYPGLSPTGATVEALRASANQKMAGEAGTPAWYQANYKVKVIDGASTQARLRSIHKLNARQTPDADNKDFTSEELKLAELSLQTLTETVLSLLQYVRLGRKKTFREADGTAGSYGGQTFWNGSNKTIVMYDSGMNANVSAFRGGSEGVNVPQAMLFTHEMGHIMQPTTNGKPAFDKFVRAAGIRPFTHYAESKPDTDFFTEAFAIYQTDPEWLRRNHATVYQWMNEFNRTGKAPK